MPFLHPGDSANQQAEQWESNRHGLSTVKRPSHQHKVNDSCHHWLIAAGKGQRDNAAILLPVATDGDTDREGDEDTDEQ